MPEYKEHPILRRTKKPFTGQSKLSFVMPFQPSMWNETGIQSALSNITILASAKLKNKYIDTYAEIILGRLKGLLSNLNLYTHSKSIAVLLSKESEKIIYLNFPVQLSITCSTDISILNLAVAQPETDFYISVIGIEKIVLYEHVNCSLHKLYEQQLNETSKHAGVEAGKKISSVLAYMTDMYQKPIFIIGTEEQLSSIKWVAPFPETIFEIIKPAAPNSADAIQIIVKEIIVRWQYWLSGFHLININRAAKNDSLVFSSEKVFEALCKNAGGLLLIEKRLKKELHKRADFFTQYQGDNDFIRQIEKFLSRGNRLKFKENGFLKNWGGIVLLPEKMFGYPGDLSFRNQRMSAESGSLF